MKPLELDDFLKDDRTEPEAEEISAEAVELPEEIDVQRAVVEAFAEEKVNLETEIENLKKALASANEEIERLNAAIKEKDAEAAKNKEIISRFSETEENLKKKYEEEKKAREKAEEKEYDQQERNPNFLALLDRDVEIPDRFPGETRDHVIDVIEEAWKKAEQEGRCRLAQVLEGVLASNERNGTLDSKRNELKKLFSDNLNIINGQVISALEKMGISHKKGDDYLTIDEIIAKNF